MRRKFEWRYFTPIYIAFGVIVISLALTACQTTAPVYNGSTLFQGYCASCHGERGKGNGPVAPHLLNEVPDLSTMAARYAGPLNKTEIIETIDGRTMRAVHGSKDMPVWGWAFQEIEHSEARTQARLDALASYVMSLQD